ncbi:MAG: toprim domain-containing protein [Candidatus Paceibacterota bacterium]
MIFEKLTELFLKFPGIGPRQARRFAYFLAGENKDFASALAEAILEIKKNAKQCSSCFRFYESLTPGVGSPLCGICSSPNRDSSLLMVVEKNVDLDNLEKTGVYNGKYFILGGTISLNGKNNASELRFKDLFEMLRQSSVQGEPLEIILALSATIEGENTSRYIEKILQPLSSKGGQEIKTSKLGRGLSTGTELEYIDSETLNNALKNRS